MLFGCVTGLHEELDHQVVALQQAMQVQVTGGAKRSRRSTVADASLEAKLEPYVRTCLQCSEDKASLASMIVRRFFFPCCGNMDTCLVSADMVGRS